MCIRLDFHDDCNDTVESSGDSGKLVRELFIRRLYLNGDVVL